MLSRKTLSRPAQTHFNTGGGLRGGLLYGTSTLGSSTPGGEPPRCWRLIDIAEPLALQDLAHTSHPTYTTGWQHLHVPQRSMTPQCPPGTVYNPLHKTGCHVDLFRSATAAKPVPAEVLRDTGENRCFMVSDERLEKAATCSKVAHTATPTTDRLSPCWVCPDPSQNMGSGAGGRVVLSQAR
jgi:hypothetical protein